LAKFRRYQEKPTVATSQTVAVSVAPKITQVQRARARLGP